MPNRAIAIEGLPGSTWDYLSHDVDSLVGTGAMGFINQGIDWMKLPGGAMLNSYGEFRYRFRSENRTYFDAYGEALGIELRKSSLHLGVDYFWERFPELAGGNSNTFEYYLYGFYDWDLKGKNIDKVAGFPGSTWFEVFRDANNLEGNGAMGFINQGIDWVKLPGGVMLNTFEEFRYRFRSENRPYFNAYGEALGVEFKKSIFHLGVDFFWERYPELDAASNKVEFYLSWFYDWDLKSKPAGKTMGH
ncbi:MAG: hypothetical protein ACYDBV_07720 [Nitrospiria bacterium]